MDFRVGFRLSLESCLCDTASWSRANEHTQPRARCAAAGGGQARAWGGPRVAGTARHARLGLLTTMDSSLASPSRLRAARKLHGSHRLAGFLCPGDRPRVPALHTPRDRQVQPLSRYIEAERAWRMSSPPCPHPGPVRYPWIRRIRRRELAGRTSFQVPSFPLLAGAAPHPALASRIVLNEIKQTGPGAPEL